MSEEKMNEANLDETNDANTEEVNEETSSKTEHIHEMPEHKEDEKIARSARKTTTKSHHQRRAMPSTTF